MQKDFFFLLFVPNLRVILDILGSLRSLLE